MVWLLGNNLDYDGAKQLQIARSPLLELTAIFSEDHNEWVQWVDFKAFYEILLVFTFKFYPSKT